MRHKAKFVKPPFVGWCRRITRLHGKKPRYNYVDNLFWKRFQTLLNVEEEKSNG